MKKILIFSCLTSIFLFADGGTILNHQKTIQASSKKLENIKQHLQELDRFLEKYDTFATTYLRELRLIITKGAKCEILKERYLYTREKEGEYGTFTVILKGRYDDCYQMKANRMIAIKNVKKKAGSLKKKVDDILRLKEIDIDEANDIKEYIDGLRNSITLYQNNSNL